jgi:Zn-finger nucleic acid-binding protein
MLPMTRICPNCANPMKIETVHGVQLDVCECCAGIWFNADEIRALLAADPKSLAELEDQAVPHQEQRKVGPSKMLCPDDHVLLDEFHYLYNSPVLLHTCATCGGVFVADGELSQMQSWYDKSHEPMTKEEQDRVNMAVDVAQHETFMLRQQRLQGLFTGLQRFRPGWFGFFP